MILFALSSINFKSSSLNFTSSAIMYLELLYISSNVLALFLRKVRDILTKIISEKYSKSNLENLPKTAAFFSEKDEVVNDNYKLKDKEFISIIPPIGGG